MNTAVEAREPSSITEWLDQNIHSHGLYSASTLGELKPFGFDVQIVAGKEPRAILTYSYKQGRLTLQTVKSVQKEIKSDPRGGEVHGDPDELLFAGYWLSASLTRLLLGDSPGAQYFGRGFAYQADVAALKAAGF